MKLFDDALQDVRFALRQLRKTPGFTWTAILTVALGLCASVAIFTFVDAALIKPLPYREPSRLVGVFERVEMFPQSNLSYQDYLDWKRMNRVFVSLAAYQRNDGILTTPSGTERVRLARISDDFLSTLGVAPMLGRDFRAGEDLPTVGRSALLSYAAWQKRYGGRSDALGQAVTINGDPVLIVGVLPPSFHFAPAEPAEFWVTLHADNPCELRRSCHNLYGVARLKEGVSVDTAAANIASIAGQLERQYPDSNRGQGSAVVPLTEVIVGNIRRLLMVLLGGAALLMLIASVNVASLMLVRSESRRREIAVRHALGASQWRVIRQFITEAVLLAVAGTVIGLVCAYWASALLAGLVPEDLMARMPYLKEAGPNGRVLLFAAGIAAAAASVFAFTPVAHLRLSRTRANLAEGSRGSAGLGWRRLGSKLVILELATAMVLLVGAGLLGESLQHLLRVDLGIDADHLATLGVAMPDQTYSTDERLAAGARRIMDRIERLPGVTSAGLSSRAPLVGGNTMWIRVVGRPYHGEHNEVLYREVSPGYFRTLKARLLRGRFFDEHDDATRPSVILINEAMARQYFPGQNPIGQQLLYTAGSQPPMEIVGVVDDIKENALDAVTPATVYVAFNQDPTTDFFVFARTARDEKALLPALVAAIREIDPGISTASGSSMSDRVNESPAAYLRRSSASLMGGFAAAAWLLGVIGLYGVVAYSVSQRTREVGVRIALGAQSSSVYRLILVEAGALILIGLGLGAACALGLAPLMRGLLFGVQTWDLRTLGAVTAVLTVSTLVASYLPARRAAAVNPVDALRSE
jgi:macrolide transport system ATP-binding/permease protein